MRNKKRYNIYLSLPLARKLDFVGQVPGAKSALVEEALRARLEPEQVPGANEVLVRRLNELHRIVGGIGRDVAIATETLALFVRYFLTITPPLPQSEQEPARLLGKERFQVFVAQVGRRLAGDQRLVAEVLASIASNKPDLFAVAAGESAEAVSNSERAPAASQHASVREDAAAPETAHELLPGDGTHG
jgi:hypothetical protein